MVKLWVVDPPSGRKYGWLRVLVENEDYEEHLRKYSYPEKDISFVLQHLCFWIADSEDGTY